MEQEVIHSVKFCPSGRGKAQCPANPDYPNGRFMDCASKALPSCNIGIPYPAPECGVWHISCARCGISILVTAAGRADDPRGLTVNCKETA